VIGTFCLYVPEEIIRALGGIAVGLCAGAEWAYDEVERLLGVLTGTSFAEGALETAKVQQ
jgi:benzoyl-CoA reductase/2-hydroxyglutaryl-CoA dehydratase subunit BcrC/BadD/HgdB